MEQTQEQERAADAVEDALAAFSDLLGTVDQWGSECMFGEGHKSKQAYGECNDADCPSVEYRQKLAKADEAIEARRKWVDVSDDAAFEGRTAVGLAIGSVAASGDLRLAVTLQDGTRVPVQLPHKYLHGAGGVNHFIKENCHP